VHGTPTTKNSTHLVLSHDGSAALFESQESDLVDGNQNTAGQDIYRVVNGTTQVENRGENNQQLIGVGSQPAVSADGNTVAFTFAQGASAASLAKDTLTGNVWTGAAGQPKHPVVPNANGASGDPSVSGDGKKLVFCSDASNLVDNDTNGHSDVFLADPTDPSQAVERISIDANGAQLDGDSCDPHISADGSMVVFTLSDQTLFGNLSRQIVRKDLTTHALELISRSAADASKGGNGDSTEPVVSANGFTIAFTSAASNLDGLGTPVGNQEAFVSLLSQNGDGTRLLKRLRNAAGPAPNGPTLHPQLSDDGTIAVVQTLATNFFAASDAKIAKDTAPPTCSFTITTNYLNVTAPTPCASQSDSQNPVISGDGGTTGFDSNMPQPNTSSSNQNAYTQALGIAPTHVANASGDYSGQWYDPNQNGHGLVIDVLRPDADNQRRVSVIWFVYANGQPTWVLGAGPAHASASGAVEVQLDQVYFCIGGGFPRGPNDVACSNWGSIHLTFADANTGTMQWTSAAAGFNSGSLAITHFQPVALPGDDAAGAMIRACYSGNWYNPAENGHGFEFNVLPTNPPKLTADWFAYDPTGKPVWLVGNAPISGNTAQMHLFRVDGNGAKFPPQFDASQVTAHDWGTATFTFTDAGHASVTWNSTEAGYGTGTQPLTPAVQVGELDRRGCQ